MSRFIPTRDASGAIVGMRRPDDTTVFADTLASTMDAVRAPDDQVDDASAVDPRAPLTLTRLDALALVAGLLLATVLIAALNTFWPAPAPRLPATTAPAATAAPTRAAPTATPALQQAYDAPAGAVLASVPLTVSLRYQHSGYPGWAGVDWHGAIVWVRTSASVVDLQDLAPPTPAPTATPAPVPTAVPCDPADPPFVVRLEVAPLGTVFGTSCTSSAQAQAHAEQLRDAMIVQATADAHR
jgi:hypothetical protein